MKLPKILVTGATGKTGAAVVAQLREKNWPVRAIVRSRDARSKRLDQLGVETVVADLFDPEQLLQAMQGTQRAYYCTFWDPYMIQSVVAFAVAAKAAKLEAVVSMGQWLASPAHPSLATRQAWLADQLFSLPSGVAHVRVNPGYFADNYLRVISYASHLGIFPTITGDGRDAPPSNEDIARVAVAALINPKKHEGKQYRPTGPELLSANEMVQILSRVLRRKVRRVDLPWWMFLRAARMQGAPAFQMSGLRHYIKDHKQGAFELSAPTNDVWEVTGQPPESFETTARRYAAQPRAKQTFNNWLRTVIDFVRNPVSPGYNLDRLNRELGCPMPPTPRLAMADGTLASRARRKTYASTCSPADRTS